MGKRRATATVRTKQIADQIDDMKKDKNRDERRRAMIDLMMKGGDKSLDGLVRRMGIKCTYGVDWSSEPEIHIKTVGLTGAYMARPSINPIAPLTAAFAEQLPPTPPSMKLPPTPPWTSSQGRPPMPLRPSTPSCFQTSFACFPPFGGTMVVLPQAGG